MTLIQASFFSENLNRHVYYNAVIPNTQQPLPTLYLLHGWSGSHDDWIKRTRVLELAEQYHIAIVFPNGENSFYVDFSEAESYGKMVAEDLVNETRQLLNLSDKREDTWIAGLSMGGYGALRLGFLYPEIFSKITGLSSRIIAKGMDGLNYDDYNQLPPTIKNVFIRKTPEEIEQEMDLAVLANGIQQWPVIELYCGIEDSFYQNNKEFYLWLSQMNPSVKFYEDEGDHNWDYWNKVIEPVIHRLVENE